MVKIVQRARNHKYIEDLVTREHFQRFNEIRNSGVTNMLDSRVVCRLADITPEVHRYIVNNYNELLNKYGDDTD